MKLSDQHLKRLASYQASDKKAESLIRASVSLILRDGEQGTEFLMMQRSFNDKDPWSGQMAFPGGKIEASDYSAKSAAIRETDEEVSISLDEHQYLGRLDDLYGLRVDNKYSVHISCFVFKLLSAVKAKGNYEVADLVWIPLSMLSNPDYAHTLHHPHDNKLEIPGLALNLDKQQIIWGLSLRILVNFFEQLELPFSSLNNDDIVYLKEMEKKASAHNG